MIIKNSESLDIMNKLVTVEMTMAEMLILATVIGDTSKSTRLCDIKNNWTLPTEYRNRLYEIELNNNLGSVIYEDISKFLEKNKMMDTSDDEVDENNYLIYP